MIVFLVEDYSMRQFLDGILPRLGFDEHIFEIKHHRGKEDLISHLDKIIPSLSKRAQQIIVIIDQDKKDCVALKNEIEEKMAHCSCKHKIRIACYELEAWFLGDMAAIEKCSPRFKARSFQGKKKYRDVDNIEKPSTVIAKIVPDWNDKYASKPKFAQTIAQFVSLERQNLKQANRSNSFHVLLETLFSLLRQ
jgi:hypothetical protein